MFRTTLKPVPDNKILDFFGSWEGSVDETSLHNIVMCIKKPNEEVLGWGQEVKNPSSVLEEVKKQLETYHSTRKMYKKNTKLNQAQDDLYNAAVTAYNEAILDLRRLSQAEGEGFIQKRDIKDKLNVITTTMENLNEVLKDTLVCQASENKGSSSSPRNNNIAAKLNSLKENIDSVSGQPDSNKKLTGALLLVVGLALIVLTILLQPELVWLPIIIAGGGGMFLKQGCRHGLSKGVKNVVDAAQRVVDKEDSSEVQPVVDKGDSSEVELQKRGARFRSS